MLTRMVMKSNVVSESQAGYQAVIDYEQEQEQDSRPGDGQRSGWLVYLGSMGSGMMSKESFVSPTRVASACRWLSLRQERVLAVWILLSLVGMMVWSGGSVWRLRGLMDIHQTRPRNLVFQVDVNAANWQELTLLPRIGETISQRIVESRDREGPYRRPEDLLRVHGIGPKTLEQVRPYLVTQGAQPPSIGTETMPKHGMGRNGLRFLGEGIGSR